ncbi:hypothetical protein L1987_13385 [Smallanthus sonchifolius]|uniref:Uncharacterized protein n=1 Tax=Smallanthus sonchifolius TaxID=185202 RepID=A0ACB9JH79_9ASTR|nr:hypothetical protein L1987_13385 [Smallanthus sonchifolius]
MFNFHALQLTLPIEVIAQSLPFNSVSYRDPVTKLIRQTSLCSTNRISINSVSLQIVRFCGYDLRNTGYYSY